jgi:hypothetical protein
MAELAALLALAQEQEEPAERPLAATQIPQAQPARRVQVVLVELVALVRLVLLEALEETKQTDPQALHPEQAAAVVEASTVGVAQVRLDVFLSISQLPVVVLQPLDRRQ